MAFGSKKPREQEQPGVSEPADDAAPAPDDAPDDAPEDAPELADSPQELPHSAPPEPAAGAGPDTDALLSMFKDAQVQTEDISVLLDLAGDVDLDDLLEQLSTVAAALGIIAATAEPRHPAATEPLALAA